VPRVSSLRTSIAPIRAALTILMVLALVLVQFAADAQAAACIADVATPTTLSPSHPVAIDRAAPASVARAVPAERPCTDDLCSFGSHFAALNIAPSAPIRDLAVDPIDPGLPRRLAGLDIAPPLPPPRETD